MKNVLDASAMLEFQFAHFPLFYCRRLFTGEACTMRICHQHCHGFDGAIPFNARSEMQSNNGTLTMRTHEITGFECFKSFFLCAMTLYGHLSHCFDFLHQLCWHKQTHWSRWKFRSNSVTIHFAVWALLFVACWLVGWRVAWLDTNTTYFDDFCSSDLRGKFNCLPKTIKLL